MTLAILLASRTERSVSKDICNLPAASFQDPLYLSSDPGMRPDLLMKTIHNVQQAASLASAAAPQLHPLQLLPDCI